MTSPRRPPISVQSGTPLVEVSDYGVAPLSRNTALRAVGPAVYAARCADGVIKVGYTADLSSRLRTLQPCELLGFRPGTLGDEAVLHTLLADNRHHGREWYHPTAQVLNVVNEMRDELGLPLIEV